MVESITNTGFLPVDIKDEYIKYLKNLKKDSLPPVIKSESLKREASTDLKKSNLFKNYFASVVTDDDYEYFEPSEQHNFEENDITLTEIIIEAELKSLNISKAEVTIRYHPYCLRNEGYQSLRPFETCSVISSDCANFHQHGRMELSVRYTNTVTKEKFRTMGQLLFGT